MSENTRGSDSGSGSDSARGSASSTLRSLPGYSLADQLATLSDCDPRDLGPADLSLLRRLLETPDEGFGMFLFAGLVFGYRDLTLDIHLPICRLLSRWGDNVYTDGYVSSSPPTGILEAEHGPVVESYQRLMVCIPRESFKTSLGTRVNSVWQCCRNPRATVGVFNEKEDNAKDWIAAIARTLEGSHLFQLLWPEMLPRGVTFADKQRGIGRARDCKWGAGGIRFECADPGIPEDSIEPHGIGGAATGKHFTHKILDDIIGEKSVRSSESQAIMEAAWSWLKNSRPLERPAENGKELVNHTPWGVRDVYVRMLEHWPGEYRVYKRHILENERGEPDELEGVSIFPQKISTRKAKQILQTDPEINWAQYQCEPRPAPGSGLSADWLQLGVMTGSPAQPLFRIEDDFYNPSVFDHEILDDEPETLAPQLVPLSWCSKAVLLDPAPSKSTEQRRYPRSANGIVAVARDPWGRRLLLEARALHDTPNAVLGEIMAMCERWSTQRVGIEEVNFSAIYAPLWTEIAQYKYDFVPEFIPLLTGGWDKVERIKQKLIRVLENQRWVFNRSGTALARKEVMEFGTAGCTMDILDAMSYTDDACERPETPGELQLRYHRQRREERDRGLTGYGRFMSREPQRGVRW